MLIRINFRFNDSHGKPSKVNSDNATNFISTNGELQLLDKYIQQNKRKLVRIYFNEGENYHFIPVSSSHFGGLGEARIKSPKYHRQMVTDNVNWIFEKYFFVCLNENSSISHTFSPLSTNPKDLNPLIEIFLLTSTKRR